MLLRWGYRQFTCCACASVAALVVAMVAGPIALDGSLLDLLVKAREVVFHTDDDPQPSPVAVIALDARSLASTELSSYPRVLLSPVWAGLLDSVFDGGVRAVGFDMILSYSANRFQPGFDLPFVAGLYNHREKVVLARSAATLPALPFLAALNNDERALGLAEVVADPDGRYRRVRASYDTKDGGALPSLADALLLRAKAPTIPNEIILAPRRHLEKIPTYAVVDVLRCAKTTPEALKQVFRGKIVLIGSTLAEEDRKVSSGRFLAPQRIDAPPIHPCGLKRLGASVPDSMTVPGVFIHAAAVEAVVNGRVMSTVPALVTVALSTVTAASGAALGMFLSPWLTLAFIFVTAILIFGAATVFLSADVWIPVALPLGALVIGPVIAYVVRYLVEERTRRRIQNAFSHYLSPMIVDRLASDASALKLGGERREVTVMFADLSGFTALSGKVEPEVLTRMVNQYLSHVVQAAEATNGYVDKFIGDAVMAIWGAPVGDTKHAVNAIRAAMAAAARIRQEKEAAEARGERSFSVKIGMNSGPAVVGNVGTENRYNYTAVGETVNVASRLESVPGIYGCQIVVGPRTAELAKEEFLMRELDWIKVKGREEPLAVFEPLVELEKAPRQQIERAQRFAQALKCYRAMRFADASVIWEELAKEEAIFAVSLDSKGELTINPSSILAERARVFAANPPVGAWDGIWVLTGK